MSSARLIIKDGQSIGQFYNPFNGTPEEIIPFLEKAMGVESAGPILPSPKNADFLYTVDLKARMITIELDIGQKPIQSCP